MCDERELAQWGRAAVTRRQLGVLSVTGATGALAACAPMTGGRASTAAALEEDPVSFATADGTLDGEFYRRPGTRAPGVLLWPDIAGIRPAKRMMARRLAKAGHAVLLANPYYRDARGQQFADFADFAGNGGWEKVGPWRGRFTTATIMTDARAAAAWLMRQPAVDNRRSIGTQGYCMTGSFALIGPAAAPEIRAGASFHGGGLVRDADPQSPHRMLRPAGRYLIAIARNDDAKAPAEKDALRAAAAAAKAPAEIAVYPADHGWCVPDSPSYNQAEAERAWTRLLALYDTL